MSKVTNLRRFRKQKARAEKAGRGDANAARFGRTRAEAQAEKTRAEKARATLEAHRREDRGE